MKVNTNLQTIANQLGVSRSTVSRALRSDERISQATRHRVAEHARKLGYKQNPYLSILMHNLREGAMPAVAPVIAFVNPNASREDWHSKKTHGFIFDGAAKRAKELGFVLEEFWLGQEGMTPKRFSDILRARNIRALILGGDAQGGPKRFSTEGFAAVGVSAELHDAALHRVSTDYLGNTMLAIRSLRSKGYRRIGLALEENEAQRMRMLPRMAFLNHEYSLRESDRVGFWIGSSTDLPGFARWIRDKEPDAIVTSDWLPQKWLQPLGLRIPDDIGLAQLEPVFFPFLYSGIDGRFEKIGSAAVDLVVSQIQANEFSSPEIPNLLLTSGIWRDGWSTRDVTSETPTSPFTDYHRTVLTLASLRPSEALAKARCELADNLESSRFQLAAAASGHDWQPLSLKNAANAPFKMPAWPPRFPCPEPLPSFTGSRSIHGVPFERPEGLGENERSAIVIDSRMGHRPLASLPIALDRRAIAVYFCHFSFYGWNGYPIAGEYRFHYERGACDSLKLQAFYPETGEASLATHQDSWTTHPQFESESCKSFLLPSAEQPFEKDRYGYVLEYRCPCNLGRLVKIEFVGNQKSDTIILLAAVTLLTQPLAT